MDPLPTPTAAPLSARAAAPERRNSSSPSVLSAGNRVRVVRGPLVGLSGTLVEQDPSCRWLLQADPREGVFLRIDAESLEPI